jgi:hypothetical protein
VGPRKHTFELMPVNTAQKPRDERDRQQEDEHRLPTHARVSYYKIRGKSMGKRELLIAAAFIVAGVCVFQFAAPPVKQDDKGFSFSKLIQNAKREIKGNQTFTAPARKLTYPVGPDVTEIRIEGVNSTIKVTGEDRQDVALMLTITSTGENEATALAIAAKTEVIEDRVGNSLKLLVKFPHEESQTAAAVLLVPSRLTVRLDAARDPVVTNVKALEFLNPARGSAEITKVALVRGDQTGGSLAMSAVGDVKMKLTRVRARLSDLGLGVFDVVDGETEISASRGALEIDERRGDVLIRNHSGPIKVSGSDGQVRVEGGASEVHFDLRRAEVDAELAAGATGGIVTTEETLRVAIAEPGNVRIDAMTTGGAIDGGVWSLSPTKNGSDSRLEADLGAKTASAPRLSLRNTNADIVIRKSSKK